VSLTVTKPSPYLGCESLAILFDNGIVIDGVDYTKMLEFIDYLNAYRKYKSEIEGRADFISKNAAAQLSDYHAELSKDIVEEQNSLSDLKFQIVNAAENDYRDTVRDMQDLNLNAQNLKFNIMQALK